MVDKDFKWYVVKVISTREKKVKSTIEREIARSDQSDKINEVVCPVTLVGEIKDGKKVVVEKVLWPGYIIINMHLDSEVRQYVTKCNGVIGFAGGEKPVPLEQSEVDQILNAQESNKDVVNVKNEYNPGDRLKITDGAFVDYEATVQYVDPDKGKLSVVVSIFGRDTPVELDVWQVEKITEEN